MSSRDENQRVRDRKPFVKPELVALDVRESETGTSPDPNEFNPFLNQS